METTDKSAKLWKAFSETRSLALRNEIVLHYVGLVKSIVLRMVPTYRKHIDFDDLMSCGLLGLMDAIDKFDTSKDIKFETYASMRIRGEIIDQIRKQDWAPISMRQKIKRIEEGFSSLETKLGRSASDVEVAQYLSMNVEDVRKTLDESYTHNLVCLDELVTDHMGSDEMLASSENSPEENYVNQELKQILAQNIDRLPEKEKMVISMYYNDELTLKEIGAVLGVSESRVSQIHSKAILSLRLKMKAVM